VLNAVESDDAIPSAGQIQLRQTTIGVNFIDIYHRIVTTAPRLSEAQS